MDLAAAAAVFDAVHLLSRLRDSVNLDVLLPALSIMLLRVTDMTLVVFRTVFVVSGRTWQAALTAAAEATVWLTAAGIVFADPTPAKAIGYATGVAVGTAVGMQVVRAMRLGLVTVRLFGKPPLGSEAAELLRSMGHGATVFDGRGSSGPVEMVLSIMRRREARAAVGALGGIDGLLITVDATPGPGHTLAGVQGKEM